MTDVAEVYFALYGNDFDPDQVTRLVGMEPSSVRRQGKPVPKHSSWNVSSGRIENDVIDVYEMSNALVARLRPYEENIAAAKRQFKLQAVLQVVLWITAEESKSTPAIGFESEVISFLNSVGASIDVDTYRNVP